MKVHVLTLGEVASCMLGSALKLLLHVCTLPLSGGVGGPYQ